MCLGPTAAAIVLVHSAAVFAGFALLSPARAEAESPGASTRHAAGAEAALPRHATYLGLSRIEGAGGFLVGATVQRESNQQVYTGEELGGGLQSLAVQGTAAGKSEDSDFAQTGPTRTVTALASQQLPGVATLLMMVAMVLLRRR